MIYKLIVIHRQICRFLTTRKGRRLRLAIRPESKPSGKDRRIIFNFLYLKNTTIVLLLQKLKVIS
jgi:SMC interacting uncharacterized protein involved in chromosome segregation